MLKSYTEHSEKCVKYSCRKGKEAGSQDEGEVSTIQFEMHISRKQVQRIALEKEAKETDSKNLHPLLNQVVSFFYLTLIY